ncbi:MAG: prolyl oligopeptidase family serine peptidase [Pantoea agglomerans]
MISLPYSIQFAMSAENGIADDEFLWLEEPNSDLVKRWVKQQNQRTLECYAQREDFRLIEQQVKDFLNKDTQIPYITKLGESYYNFWQDEDNPRGLLRRTTLTEFRNDEPVWETVLDIDALGKSEGRDWVYQGSQSLAPEYRYCLIMLSPDGGDASEIREFDLVAKRFVKTGFNVPVAKSQVSWIDKDTLFISTDFGPGTLTQSGYSRIAKIWHRGTPLSAAKKIYEAKPEDLGVIAYHDSTPGFERNVVGRHLDFYRCEYFLLNEKNHRVKIDIPTDAEFDTHREWLLIKLNSEWNVGGEVYPPGALLAANFNDYLMGKRELQSLFVPTERMVLSGFSGTRDHLILSIMNNVVNQLEILTPQGGGWQRRPLGTPGTTGVISTVSAYGIDEETNDYFLTTSGFLEPESLYIGNLDNDKAELLKRETQDFDTSNYHVSQHFVSSKDGTRVPYFQISPKDVKPDGSNPTLLYGYGGFGESLLPWYLGGDIPGWLERGGVYVVANIRGGGEYGPAWHQAALKDKRHCAYEDFAAVAEDLIARKITSPSHLGARGGSNGGLLVGNMLTQYPQLFGCIVCEVPLLDMQRYTQLSAGASWIGEYGDPGNPEEWEYIKSFSPYHNIKANTTYPPVLFYTSTSDDRVNPAHARKMTALMQHLGYHQAYFYENTQGGGHSGSADNEQSAFHSALVSEFMWASISGKLGTINGRDEPFFIQTLKNGVREVLNR